MESPILLNTVGSHLNIGQAQSNYFQKSSHNFHKLSSGSGVEIKHSDTQSNMKLFEMNNKTIDYDFMDIVPANCCLLEIKAIYETMFSQETGILVSKQRDTIFIGTYDGSLHSMRFDIKKESNSESYILNNLRKWTFTHPITSVLVFDFYNKHHETLQLYQK